jgi:hypothetical protein
MNYDRATSEQELETTILGGDARDRSNLLAAYCSLGSTSGL